MVRPGKASRLRYQRPKEAQRPPGQAADGRHIHQAAGWRLGAAEHLIVGQGECALGNQDQDLVGGHALSQQVEQPTHSKGGLARAGRPGEEHGPIAGVRSRDQVSVHPLPSFCHGPGHLFASEPE